MRIRIIAVVATFSLLFGAGIASASTDETDPRVDTLFRYGYDPQMQLFFSDTYATDSSALDCTLAGTLTATYGDAGEDGVVPIIELVDDKGAAVEFEATEYELAGPLTPALGPVPYFKAIDECGISGIPIGGEGPINHGQIMKLFNEIIDMRGRGCLNRWLGQSNLGKADVEIDSEDNIIEFTTALADCDRGKKDKAEDHPGRGHNKDGTDAADTDQDQGQGRPDSPGKSDQAPGRDKDK